MAQDRKFRFDHEVGQFVNRVSGEAIPDDEPVIIFRARDIHALRVLDFYHNLIEDPHHSQAIRERIEEFLSFMRMHPERMKEPGITHHVELHSSRRDLHESRRHESSQDDRLDHLEHEEATLERKMRNAMADIDILNSVLGNIANDAASLTADFKNLEAELQAAQEAAANNQPIDLSNSILLARQAQAALDGIVAAAGEAGVGPAAPSVEQPPADTGTGAGDGSDAGAGDGSDAVEPVPIVIGALLPNGTVGADYTGSLDISGGTAPYSVNSSPPGANGITINADGSVTGIPEAAADLSFSVSVTDSATPSASASNAVTLHCE